MTIDTMDALVSALGNNSTRIILDKSSISNTAAGQFHSLWRANGQPSAGPQPTSAAVVTLGDTGTFNFANQISPATSYIGGMEALCSNAGATLEIHDRLMHSGAAVGNVTTAQTNIAVDLNGVTESNMVARIGDANFSDVQWWLEWYADTGTTAVTATVNVTYSDGSSGNLAPISLASSRRPSYMQPLNTFQNHGQNKFIRAVNSVTLSATAGGTGNFGVTATRFRGAIYMPSANSRFTADWAQMILPEIYNDSALFAVMAVATTTTGTVRATGKIIHG